MKNTTESRPAIEIRDATLSYSLPHRATRLAVDQLSLTVNEGEVFGLLGANGAGKTTTIKMLLGFLAPDSGSVQVFGEPCAEHTTRRHIGYLPEQPYFHAFLSPMEVLRLHADLIAMPRRDRDQQIEQLLAVTRLADNRRLPLSKLSKGNQQRVGIAQALLGSPRLLVLDEPTSGLDPKGRHEMREIIAAQKSEGRTVFVSSHVLSEIETLCDRVAILSNGHLVACGAPSDIRRSDGRMQICTSDIPPEAVDELSRLGCSIEAGEMSIVFCPEGSVFGVTRVLERFGLTLHSARSETESLEDAFLRLAA